MNRKIFDRGYWISKLFFFLSMVYYFLLSFWFRSFTFFSACNPAMKMGGMLDDEKSDIEELFPEGLFPKTIQYRHGVDDLSSNKLDFPVFVKPDIGLKGHDAALIENRLLLQEYFKGKEADKVYLIQEYIDKEKEYSILFVKKPGTGSIEITSLTEKIYPFVIGNEIATLAELIELHKNPFLKKDWIYKRLQNRLDHIPKKEEKIIIEKIGNYSRGAKFYSRQELISDKLKLEIQRVLSGVESIYFGRFDLKVDSLLDFENGNWRAIELNGTKAEPLHIYDPNYSVIKSIRDIHRHWMDMKSVAKQVIKSGYQLPSTSEGLRSKRRLKELT